MNITIVTVQNKITNHIKYNIMYIYYIHQAPFTHFFPLCTVIDVSLKTTNGRCSLNA